MLRKFLSMQSLSGLSHSIRIIKFGVIKNLMGDRSDKFEKKISGDIAKQRYDAQKEYMTRKEKVYFADAVATENKIKEVLNDVGSFEIVYYIIFAKELQKLKRKHSEATLMQEVGVLERKWEIRGLNIDNLVKVKELYVPILLNVCRFDVGKYDKNLYA